MTEEARRLLGMIEQSARILRQQTAPDIHPIQWHALLQLAEYLKEEVAYERVSAPDHGPAAPGV